MTTALIQRLSIRIAAGTFVMRGADPSHSHAMPVATQAGCASVRLVKEL